MSTPFSFWVFMSPCRKKEPNVFNQTNSYILYQDWASVYQHGCWLLTTIKVNHSDIVENILIHNKKNAAWYTPNGRCHTSLQALPLTTFNSLVFLKLFGVSVSFINNNLRTSPCCPQSLSTVLFKPGITKFLKHVFFHLFLLIQES